MVFGTMCVVFCIICCCLFDNASRAAFCRYLQISNTFSQTFGDVFGEGWKYWFLKPLQWKIIVFECPGPPISNYFCNCFPIPSRTSFLVFFCRFVGRQGSRFGASGLLFVTQKKEAKKVMRLYAGVCGCMRDGRGVPYKDQRHAHQGWLPTSVHSSGA